MNKFKKISLMLAVAVSVTAAPAAAYAGGTSEYGSGAAEPQRTAYISISGIEDSGADSEDQSSADPEGQSDQQLDGDATEETDSADSTDEDNPYVPDDESRDSDDSAGNDENGGNEAFDEPASPTLSVTVKLNTTDHMKYMNGSGDGLFHPGDALTKAEAAQMINSLITDAADTDIIQNITFSDVDPEMWYAQAINNLASYGVISGGSSGLFRPTVYISRAEFIKMLSCFSQASADSEDAQQTSLDTAGFTDLPESHWAHDIILSAVDQGWLTGYSDGTVRPDATLSKAEAAAVTNRMIGRYPDTATITSASGIRIFPDVDNWHWAYGDIMEATIGHEYTSYGSSESWTSFTQEKTVLSPGFHLIRGVLYRVDDGTGDFYRNQYIEGHWYDASGKYTTGNDTLDALMREATRACVTSDMTQHQMLKATFDYMVNNFSYLSRAKLTTGAKGWTEEYAVPMFQKHKGNCYSFAAAYYYLTKNIGYDPREVAGLVGHNRSPHGWIEIDIGGRTYIYDTELTMAKRKAGYSYYLFEMTYGNAPFIYAKS